MVDANHALDALVDALDGRCLSCNTVFWNFA